MLNPDVVTREMGVMEKCTFCVQRIREVKDLRRDEVYAEGGLEGRENNLPNTRVPEDKLKKLPACAAACPTGAMTFGNLKVKPSDPETGKDYVFSKFQDERAFAMLTELNTKPAIRYLARINHGPSKLHGH